MTRRPPLLVRLALSAIRVVSWLVPGRDRTGWKREWTGEILHSHATAGEAQHHSWSQQMSLFRRSLGSVSDAAWLRRQFTRDSELVHDVRHGWRVLRRQPGFSLLAMLVLALGIGSSAAVFSVADALLLQKLPYPAEHELVAIWQQDTADASQVRGGVAPANFLDWRERVQAFTAIAAADPYSMDYTGGDRPIVLFGTVVTEGFFDILGIQPLHGRLFGPDDHVAGQNQVAILEHGLWRDRFGSDPAIVGQAIPLDGQPYTIVGVLPPDFELNLLESPGRRELWTPKVFQEYERTTRGPGWWAAIGRIGPDVTFGQARADLARVSADLAEQHPRTNANTLATIEPLGEHLMAEARPALALLLGAVVVVLLIACANVTNMLLARVSDRDREFSVRGALGAGRGRLVRQLLTETGLIALGGAIGGLFVAGWLLDTMVALAPSQLTRLTSVGLDWSLVLLAAGAGVAAALIAGLLPAVQFSRPGQPEALGSGSRTTSTRSSRIIGDGLAIAEIALAVALVIGAGLLLRSFTRLLAVNPGFQVQNVLALQVFAWDLQAEPEKLVGFFHDTIEDLAALPGVLEAGAVSAMPLISSDIDMPAPITIEGRPPLPEGQQDLASLTIATPGYFSAMDIPLLSGRGLAVTDTADSEAVAVVSRPMADRFWPGDDPVGAVLTVPFASGTTRVRIVGVVGDVRHTGLEHPAREEFYVPLAQAPFGSMTYVVHTVGDPADVLKSAQEAVWAHDPLLTFYDTTTVQQLVDSSVAPRRFSLVLVGIFAASALVLAGVGIYGVLSFTTERRMREFGMRIALGATRSDVARLVIGRGLRLGAIGLVCGLGIAVAGGRWLESALFEVSVLDPVTLVAVSAAALSLAVLACYAPARRATKVDPLAMLRT